MNKNEFTDNLIEIDFKKKYSKPNSELLKKSIRAVNMEDKWNIIFEQDTLSFYRSWTGRGIFKIKFTQKNSQLSIEKAYAEEKFINASNKEYCCKLLNWLIEVVVFKQRIELPKIKK